MNPEQPGSDLRKRFRRDDSGDSEPDCAEVAQLAADALLRVELLRRAAAAPNLTRVAFDTNRLTPVERRVLLAYLATARTTPRPTGTES